MNAKRSLLMLLLPALICVPAAAEITIPWDTNPYGTHQVWNFDAAPANFNNIPADVDHNPFGSPYAGVAAAGPGAVGPVWNANGPGSPGAGVVYATPRMIVKVALPNVINEELTKIVQVELQYHVQVGDGHGYEYSFIRGHIPGDAYGPQLDPEWWNEELIRTTADGAWYDLTLQFEIPQIYDFDVVTVSLHDSGVYLDSVEAATVCVPVPGAVLLGMLGLVAAGRKLRRMV